MRITVTHQFSPEAERLLRGLSVGIPAAIYQLEKRLMASLDQVLDKVSEQTTKLDSVVALIDGLKQQVKDALEGVTLPPAVQAKVDAIFAGATTNSEKIADALDENVETVEM
jgi:hypothetical protein